jgi:hypothetical protein
MGYISFAIALTALARFASVAHREKTRAQKEKAV